MNLDEFERKGYTPEQVTQSDWVNLQRAARRVLEAVPPARARHADVLFEQRSDQRLARSPHLRGHDRMPVMVVSMIRVDFDLDFGARERVRLVMPVVVRVFELLQERRDRV